MAWSGAQWEGTWAAIRRVWASKWNDRAVLSLRRAGLPHAALQMAVLAQEVVPAQYAFVAHTTNPLTGALAPPRAVSGQSLLQRAPLEVTREHVSLKTCSCAQSSFAWRRCCPVRMTRRGGWTWLCIGYGVQRADSLDAGRALPVPASPG